MEKKLLVVFGVNPAPNTLDCACYLSDMGRSKLSGYFFEDDKYEAKPVVKRASGFSYVETVVAGDLPEIVEQREETDENIVKFMQACEKRGVLATAHRTNSSLITDIIAESRLADFLIIDAAASSDNEVNELPSSLVKEILATSQCPVIIAPIAHSPIEEIIFCFDGTPSSLFAMKQFVYLLPELDSARATVVQINNAEDIPASEKKIVMNWLSRHYNYSDFITLKGNGEEELLTYLLKKNNAIVVMGAYGRNMLSRFFRKSHADLLIKAMAHPLFIAHY